MHSLPFWTCVACTLAERSRSAPQALGILTRDGCRRSSSPAAQDRRSGRSRNRKSDCKNTPGSGVPG
eukprot:6177511-Pleurochrysis_carterae.AAC.4